MKDYQNKIKELIVRVKLDQLFEKDSITKQAVQSLHCCEDGKEALLNIWVKRVCSLLAGGLICILLLVYCVMQEPEQGDVLAGGKLEREDGKNVSFQATVNMDDGALSEELTMYLDKRKFTKEECEEIEKIVDNYVSKAVLGNNKSLNHVNQQLKLVKSIPNTGARIEWNVDERYLDSEGNISAPESEETIQTVLSAQVMWNNWEKNYDFEITLEPAKQSKQELLKKEVVKAVHAAVESQATSEIINLPDKVSGCKVTYDNKEGTKNFSLFFLSIFVVILLPFLWFQRQKEELKKRDEQLMLDYPVLINKVVLLLSAGLTIRGCLERICDEYKRRMECEDGRRYAYEELCICYQEMCNGVSEASAIEAFGRRCRQLPYMRFASIINQNIRKGADGLIFLLEKEVIEAFEKRKELVKQMGEKAGTKLLLPMILMLGVVMAIIMIPAFMTM